MKELQGEFLLAWRCPRTDRPKLSAPFMKIHPTVNHVLSNSTSGELVILDIDGSEWKATYQNEHEMLQGIKDFNCLVTEMIRIRNGES